MHRLVNAFSLVVAVATLSACAQQQPAKPVVEVPNIHTIAKDAYHFCRANMPPAASKEDLMLCKASRGDVYSQMALAESYMTTQQSAERCKKGVWWAEHVARTEDASALAYLAEMYKGELLYKGNAGKLYCTRAGVIKKDAIKAYAHLSAAQILVERKKAGDPKKQFVSCKSDYKLQMDTWGAKLKPEQLAQAKAWAEILASGKPLPEAPASVKAKPAKPATVKAASAKVEPAKAEISLPAKPEPAKAAVPAKVEPAKVEPVKPAMVVAPAAPTSHTTTKP